MTKWDLKNLCKHKWKYVFVLNLSFWQNQSKLNSRDSVGIRKKWTLKFYSLMEDVIQRKKKSGWMKSKLKGCALDAEQNGINSCSAELMRMEQWQRLKNRQMEAAMMVDLLYCNGVSSYTNFDFFFFLIISSI